MSRRMSRVTTPQSSRMVECLREGPPTADVENVRIWKVDTLDFDGFEVRH